MESVSVVKRRKLEGMLKEGVEIVQAVRDHGASLLHHLVSSNDILMSKSLARSLFDDGFGILTCWLFTTHCGHATGNQGAGEASSQLALSTGDLVLIAQRGTQGWNFGRFSSAPLLPGLT